MVLAKTFDGDADSSNDLRTQVRLSTDPVLDLFVHRVVKQAIDSKIAPAHISLSVGKLDLARPASVRVIRLGAEGRHLKLPAVLHHNHHAELAAHGNCVRK